MVQYLTKHGAKLLGFIVVALLLIRNMHLVSGPVADWVAFGAAAAAFAYSWFYPSAPPIPVPPAVTSKRGKKS